MFIPSSIIINFCFILMILFFKSSCTYTLDSNELTDQSSALNMPSYYDRYIRTTKFPRIGRSLLDSDESSYIFDTSSEENSNELDNQLKLIGQRSVHFPRIGKRAFHNLLWANSLSNPYRMLDAQGRYYVSGYDYHVNPNSPSTTAARYRGKRNNPM